MRLVEIDASGATAEEGLAALPQSAAIGAAYKELYARYGYQPPWLGYFAMEGTACIGACGFKSPPADDRVEIAYFTFPEYEGRGYATAMARLLVDVARRADPTVTIAAQTLPAENASTSILRKLGFELTGMVDHPEDGPVWEWNIPAARRI